MTAPSTPPNTQTTTRLLPAERKRRVLPKRFGKRRAREGNNLSSKGFSVSQKKHDQPTPPRSRLPPPNRKGASSRKGLEKEEREKETTFPQKVFPSRKKNTTNQHHPEAAYPRRTGKARPHEKVWKKKSARRKQPFLKRFFRLAKKTRPTNTTPKPPTPAEQERRVLTKRFGKRRAREGNNLSSKGFSVSQKKHDQPTPPRSRLPPPNRKGASSRKGLEKEEREKETTFPQKVFPSRKKTRPPNTTSKPPTPPRPPWR